MKKLAEWTGYFCWAATACVFAMFAIDEIRLWRQRKAARSNWPENLRKNGRPRETDL